MELSFTARAGHEYGAGRTRGQYYKTLAIVRCKEVDFASELKEQKGEPIWLNGSARELLITSHVIELRSQPRQPPRGRDGERKAADARSHRDAEAAPR